MEEYIFGEVFVTYDREAKMLYIRNLGSGEDICKTVAVADGRVNVDLDMAGEPVGLEVFL